MKLESLILIGMGGGLGAICRALLAQACKADFPWATLFINIAGAALLGLYFAWESHGARLPSGSREFLAVGFCGGFTTFSTFSLETLKLLQAGQITHAWLNILSSVLLSLLAVWLGWRLGRFLCC